ncbi:MAG TPA: DrmB family protein [Myxococcaceae bacterium]
MATKGRPFKPVKPFAGMQRARPDGSIRRSQVVTTFGPGALVDLVDHAVMVSGLDFWRFGPQDSALRHVDEPRLRDDLEVRLRASGRKLAKDRAFRLPPSVDERDAVREIGIAAPEFPRWFVCTNPACEALIRASSQQRGPRNKYVHDCGTREHQQTPCVPVRFLVACPRGHIDDFPWIRFAHEKGSCPTPSLRLSEGPIGDIAALRVTCGCGASRGMLDAYESHQLPLCQGHRPWLGPEGKEKDCRQLQRLLVRTASNAYFPQVESALTLPDADVDVKAQVRRFWGVLEHATAEDLPSVRRLQRGFQEALGRVPDEEILRAIAEHRGQAVRRERIREAEFRTLTSAEPERPGQVPPPGAIFFARRWQPAEPLPAGIRSIVLVPKLREVRVQVGFTRLDSRSPDLRGEHELGVETASLGLHTEWLPAAEILGEGLFIQFDEDVIRDWEDRPAVAGREKALQDGYDRAASRQALPPFPGARFYMLHSLSHLLLSALSLECGYPATAIKERIYCSYREDPGAPMAAILLSTGTSGTEGTLGGLIEEGRRFHQHLRRALEMAALCSNDPVCASHDPKGLHDRPLEGAACHGCLFVAESSCERYNHFLDRALVVPTFGDTGCAFFGR